MTEPDFDEFRAPRNVLGKWTTRDGHSFEEHFAMQAQKSLSLYWYVNPESRWPVKLQLIGLWVKRYVFRKQLK